MEIIPQESPPGEHRAAGGDAVAENSGVKRSSERAGTHDMPLVFIVDLGVDCHASILCTVGYRSSQLRRSESQQEEAGTGQQLPLEKWY
eukprot:543830-Amphidinium_carterae.1